MLEAVTTYLIVLTPVSVGKIHGDCLRSVDAAHGTAIYRGMDRDPWYALDTAFHAKQLGHELLNLRRKIELATNKIYSCGMCSALSEIQTILSLSASGRENDELIWIDNSESVAPDGTRFLGYDFYVDGFGSLIRLGMFEKPDIFAVSLEKVNQHGLFPDLNSLAEYVNYYLENCEVAGLEVVESRRISDQGIFRIFGIGADL